MLTPDALSGDLNPSEAFGMDQGLKAYKFILDKSPALADEPIPYIAARAVKIAMAVQNEYGIDPDMATNAVITGLDSEVEAIW